MTDIADRVAMRLAEVALNQATSLLGQSEWSAKQIVAAALSSHGLREAVLQIYVGSHSEDPCMHCAAAYAALLGETASVPASAGDAERRSAKPNRRKPEPYSGGSKPEDFGCD